MPSSLAWATHLDVLPVSAEIERRVADCYDTVISQVKQNVEHYLWDRFAAQIIEESKGKPEYAETLYYILEHSLKLLHPFMPFVTEEIWGSLPQAKNLLMVEEWPAK